MTPYPENKMTRFQIIALPLCVTGMVISLWFVYTRLRFFYGVDYHMFHSWQAGYLKTGVFFPEDTVFFNFPLTVLAFGPYAFLSVNQAVALKFIQTLGLGALCFILVTRIRPGLIQKSGMARFSIVLIGLSFGLTQLFYLNIYVEVTCCLLLSLFFLERGRDGAAAFFFSLALIFKVFLLPLVLAPLICRKFGFFGRIVIWLTALGLVSILIFGWDTHVAMIRAMGETYAKMRVHGIGYPVVADGFAGWQDLFNKLVRTKLISAAMVLPLTLTAAGLYGCLALYVISRMVVASFNRSNHPDFYIHVFASLLIVSLGFNFRFDHGLLLLTAVFLFAACDPGRQGWLTLALFLITLSSLLVERVLLLSGFESVAASVSSCIQVLSFQFIGINSLVFILIIHWTDSERALRTT